MIKIDYRFSSSAMSEIEKMVGKEMIKYKCDPFLYSTSVYGIVGILVDNSSYAFTNLTEVQDYFGEKEDVAVFKMKHQPYNEIKSLIQNQEMVETPINSNISEIDVINEHQRLFNQGKQTYDVWLTRGIIFKFADSLELSFEKEIWFSEDIAIEKGYNLFQKFSPTEEFASGWSDNIRGECTREIVTYKS